MQDFKVGDRVSVLHDTVSGKIIQLQKNLVQIEDEHGFVRSYAKDQIVKAYSHDAYKIGSKIESKDETTQKKSTVLSPKKNVVKDRFEIDLHIEELRESIEGLTNHEIVQVQLRACRAFVQESLELDRKKIVIIHGKGTGVLKSEIHRYLNRLGHNSGVDLIYHDASFREYGIGGATEVVFNV